jgi:hypothetical protein
MGTQARIHDSKALLDAKAALVAFVEAVTTAIAGVDADVSRLSLWLNQDRPMHWKHEIRRREDQVLAAKTDIQRKIISQAPEPVSLVLERKAVARCQERVDEARRRLEQVKRWSPKWEKDSHLYKSGVAALSEALHRDIPMAIQRLEKMLLALEAYERLEAPSGDVASGIVRQAQEDASDDLKARERAAGTEPPPVDPQTP